LAHERTFVAVKPDGVERGLVGEILRRFEQRGLKLVGLKIMNVSQKQAEEHYGEHKGKPFFDGLVKHITSGPIVAMVWEGKDAVALTRSTIGATNPVAAAPGSIRGDLSVDIARNIVLGYDSPENAIRETNIFFSKEELLPSKEKTIDKWVWE
jgi:nucleoside-diphosphate kinase